jgi:hypothetical protein
LGLGLGLGLFFLSLSLPLPYLYSAFQSPSQWRTLRLSGKGWCKG